MGQWKTSLVPRLLSLLTDQQIYTRLCSSQSLCGAKRKLNECSYLPHLPSGLHLFIPQQKHETTELHVWTQQKEPVWGGTAIWAKWAMKASVWRQNSTEKHFSLPNVSFKLIASVLPVWKTNYPQFTCSWGLPISSFMCESVSVFKRVRHSPRHVSRSHLSPRFVWAGHTGAADPSPSEPSRSC